MPDARFAQLRREATADLDLIAERYPFFKAKHVPGLAAITAAHLADAPRRARRLAAQVSFWLVAFDELIDEEQAPEPALRRLAADLAASVAHAAGQVAPEPAALAQARAAPTTPADHLLLVLDAINQQVVSYRPPLPLIGAWRSTFDQMTAATIDQRELGRLLDRPALLAGADQGGVATTFERLLPLLRHSVGVPYYLTIGLVIAEDARVVDRLPALQPIIDAAATAIRLANDLRSWRKDERERSINSVAALTIDLARANPAWPREACREEALRQVGHRLDAAIEATHSLIASSPRPDGVWERRVARMVDVVTAWYRAPASG